MTPQLTHDNAHLDLSSLTVRPDVQLTPREQRGLDLARAGCVRREGTGFVVTGSREYHVAFTGRKYGCTCPDAVYAVRPMHTCKHEAAVRFALAEGLVGRAA